VINMKAEQKVLRSARRTGLVLLAGLSLFGASGVALADCSSSNGCADTYRGAIADAQNGYLGYFQDLQLGESLGGTKFNGKANSIPDARQTGGVIHLPWVDNGVINSGDGSYNNGNDTGSSTSGGVNYN
jgi:hypothetical protein